MIQYAPGQWELIEDDTTVEVRGPNWEVIYPIVVNPTPTQRATAHLIAAAPDLLKAGKQVLESAMMLAAARGIGLGGVAELMAAIEKAEGKAGQCGGAQ